MCRLGWLLSHGVWDSIRFWLQIILSKQEFILMDLCFMCKGHGESMARLFLLQSAMARTLWSSVLWLFGVLWVMPSSGLDLLYFGKRSNGEIWKVVPLCVMQFLWRERCPMFWGERNTHDKVEVFIFIFEDLEWQDFNFSNFLYHKLSRVPQYFKLPITFI